MPPFHSRSTGARRIAFISSAGVIVFVPERSPSALTICEVIATDLAARSMIAPPGETSEES